MHYLVGRLVPAAFSQTRSSHPNFVFIIADDHAGYVWGADGNAKSQTPNLDRFASESVRFSQHYCNSPMCTPSRQSLFTGQLPHATGVTRLMTPLKDGMPTLARQLMQRATTRQFLGRCTFRSRPFPVSMASTCP